MGFFENTANQLIAEGFNRKDVICFGGTNCSDMLTLDECDEITEACLSAIVKPEQREEVRQRLLEYKQPEAAATNWRKSPEKVEGSWKYLCAQNWRKLRSQQLMEKHNLAYPGFEPRVVDRGHVLLVEATGDGEDIARHYGLRDGFPECMSDVISDRRIDDETVIALLGDDRDLSFWVSVTFAPKRFCETFYQGGGGDTAGAFV